MFGFLSMSINEFFLKNLIYIFSFNFQNGASHPDSKLVQNGESCVLVEKVIFTCHKPPN